MTRPPKPARRTQTTQACKDSEWSYDFRSQHTSLSDSDSDFEPTTPLSPTSAPLTEDAKLLQELDLSTRQDTAQYKPNPWSIAKVNAASRVKPVESGKGCWNNKAAGNKAANKKETKGKIVDFFRSQKNDKPLVKKVEPKVASSQLARPPHSRSTPGRESLPTNGTPNITLRSFTDSASSSVSLTRNSQIPQTNGSSAAHPSVPGLRAVDNVKTSLLTSDDSSARSSSRPVLSKNTHISSTAPSVNSAAFRGNTLSGPPTIEHVPTPAGTYDLDAFDPTTNDLSTDASLSLLADNTYTNKIPPDDDHGPAFIDPRYELTDPHTSAEKIHESSICADLVHSSDDHFPSDNTLVPTVAGSDLPSTQANVFYSSPPRPPAFISSYYAPPASAFRKPQQRPSIMHSYSSPRPESSSNALQLSTRAIRRPAYIHDARTFARPAVGVVGHRPGQAVRFQTPSSTQPVQWQAQGSAHKPQELPVNNSGQWSGSLSEQVKEEHTPSRQKLQTQSRWSHANDEPNDEGPSQQEVKEEDAFHNPIRPFAIQPMSSQFQFQPSFHVKHRSQSPAPSFFFQNAPLYAQAPSRPFAAQQVPSTIVNPKPEPQEHLSAFVLSPPSCPVQRSPHSTSSKFHRGTKRSRPSPSRSPSPPPSPSPSSRHSENVSRKLKTDAYAHPSLAPTADETWSTLPTPKRARGPNASNVKSSGNFKVPTALVAARKTVLAGKTEAQRHDPGGSGSTGTVQRRVHIYRPPPRDAPMVQRGASSGGAAEGQDGGHDVRREVRESSSREKLGGENITPPLRVVHASAPQSQSTAGRAARSPSRSSLHAFRATNNKQGSHVSPNPGIRSPQTASIKVDDPDVFVFDLDSVRNRYPETRKTMRERRHARYKLWDLLGLPTINCGVVWRDPPDDAEGYAGGQGHGEIGVVVWTENRSGNADSVPPVFD